MSQFRALRLAITEKLRDRRRLQVEVCNLERSLAHKDTLYKGGGKANG